MNLIGDSNKSKLLAQSMRPAVMVIPWLVYCSVLLGFGVVNATAYILGLTLMIISYGIVTLHNDIEDRDVDLANNRADIPLANGAVTVQDIRGLMLSLMILGMIATLLLGVNALAWLGVYVCLGWLYSGPANLKGRGVWALVVLGVCYGAMPWILGYIVVSKMPSMLSLVIIGASFIFVAGSIALKDFKDEKGDRAHGKKTLLVKHGGRYVQRVILYCSVLAYVLLGLVSYYHSHSASLVIIVVLATAANYRLLSSPNILTSSGVRATHGRRAKLLFFVCAMVINVAILS